MTALLARPYAKSLPHSRHCPPTYLVHSSGRVDIHRGSEWSQDTRLEKTGRAAKQKAAFPPYPGRGVARRQGELL